MRPALTLGFSLAVLLLPSTLRAQPKTIAEPAREIPVTHSADVVVIGAGTGGLGGVTAAAAAAKNGASVILIEQGGHVGLHVPIGLGVVIGIDGWRPTIKEGLFREFAGYVSRAGQHSQKPMTEQELIDKGEIIVRHHDVVSTAAMTMMKDAGVQMLLHAKPVGTSVENGHLKAVIVESPQGRHAIAGKVFIDSTGLGDVAAFAGAPMLREEPFMSVQLFIDGVDEPKYQAWLRENAEPLDDSYKQWMVEQVGPFDKLKYPWDQWWPEYLGDRMPPAVVRQVRDAMAKKEFTLIRRRGAEGTLAISEGVKANGNVAMPRTYITGVDPLNVDDVSWAEVASREALLEFHRFLRARIPGFENSVIERMADIVSLRGGRYIKVDGRQLNTDRIQAGGTNADCIYVFQRGKEAPPFEVPFNALLPDKVEGLLVVGKATAGGVHLRTAHGVLFQGQAAGTAAALSIKDGKTVRNVDIPKLQETLRAAGVQIPPRAPQK